MRYVSFLVILLGSVAIVRADYKATIVCYLDTSGVAVPQGDLISPFYVSPGATQILGNIQPPYSVPHQYPDFPVLWNDSGSPSVPVLTGAVKSGFFGGDGKTQVGFAQFQAGDFFQTAHAIRWNGPQAVDLHPNLPGIRSSSADEVYGTQQIGVGNFPFFLDPTQTVSHAMMWSGTAASAVDLNPAGTWGSGLGGTDGTHQVGYVEIDGTQSVAAIWTGTPQSVVYLNTTDVKSAALPNPNDSVHLTRTQAWAVRGNEEVGMGEPAYGQQFATQEPLIWHGSAASAIDLRPGPQDIHIHPDGLSDYEITDTNGHQEIGSYGATNGRHALVWSGSANSAVDLHDYFPSAWGFDVSYATSIDDSGLIYGYAYSSTAPDTVAVIEWTPEPASGAGVLVFLLLALQRRHARRSVGVVA